MAPEASALQLVADKMTPGTNVDSAVFLDRYSTHIVQKITVAILKSLKDQDLYWLIGERQNHTQH